MVLISSYLGKRLSPVCFHVVPGWGFPEQGILGQDNVTTCQSLLTHMLEVQR